MATVGTKLLTAEEFFEWVNRPENEGKLFELDRGEVIEMPSPGELHGAICFLLVRLLGNYLFQRGKGYLCSNDTGLLVEHDPDTVRGPDVMLFDESRPLDELSRKFTQRIPQLVVEVLSPSDQMTKVTRRLGQYFKRGVSLVWLVDPEMRSVAVYRADKYPLVLDETDELSAEDVLPGFRCGVAELFTLPGQPA
jgi:Uma2 family endonuclease